MKRHGVPEEVRQRCTGCSDEVSVDSWLASIL